MARNPFPLVSWLPYYVRDFACYLENSAWTSYSSEV